MATTKLTLSIDADTIEQAKQYAKNQHTSLSKLIQRYLQSISTVEKTVRTNSEKDGLSEWIKELSLVDQATPDFDHKAEYGKHLEEKYGL